MTLTPKQQVEADAAMRILYQDAVEAVNSQIHHPMSAENLAGHVSGLLTRTAVHAIMEGRSVSYDEGLAILLESLARAMMMRSQR